jgi:hypothetical protein
MIPGSQTWSQLYAPDPNPSQPARYTDIAIVAGLGEDQGLGGSHSFTRTPPLRITRGTADDTIVQDQVHAFWVQSWGGYTQYRTPYPASKTPAPDASGNNIFYDSEENIGSYTTGLHAARYDGSVQWLGSNQLVWIHYRWFGFYWGIYAMPAPASNW